MMFNQQATLTENDWRRDDAAYGRMIERREKLERENGVAVAPPMYKAPRYAEIGNGLFVRVGTGRKRRAA